MAIIEGTDSGEVLEGTAGNDTFHPKGGDDTVLWGLNSGQDYLESFFVDPLYGGGVGFDTLQLSVGVTPENLRITVASAGFNTFLGIQGTTDRLQITQYAGADQPLDQIVFSDGTVWDAATIAAHASPDQRPTIDTSHASGLPGTRQRLIDVAPISDGDGDLISSFSIALDSGNTLNSARTRLWSAATNSYVTRMTSDTSSLSDVWIEAGTDPGLDRFTVEFSDGLDIPVDVNLVYTTIGPNRPPVVTPTASTQTQFATFATGALNLFSVSDPDRQTPVRYEFLDSGVGAGSFSLRGTLLPAQTPFTVEAADLPFLSYFGAAAGSEALSVRAYDGVDWSAWQSWQMRTLSLSGHLPPVLSAPANKNVLQNEWHQFSEFVSVTDADGDRMVRFEVKDDNAAAGSAFLQWNGVNTQGGLVQAETGSLGDLWVKGGANLGSDTIEIRAFDGYDWSDWKSVSVNTRVPNRAPVAVPTAATQAVVTGNSVAASTLFSVTDADGDTPTQYVFEDDGTGGGHFTVNGVTQAAFTGIAVSDPSTVQYVAGSGAGSETLWVKVNDGTVWSAWQSWQEQTLRATNTVAVLSAPANKNVLQNEWHQFSEFVSVTDADGDRMVRFEVKDDNAAAGSAFLQWNGVNTQGGLVQAETGSLGDLWVKGGANLGSDTIEIRAFDGYDWSDWKSVSVNTRVPNRAPVAVPTAATQAVVTGNSVAASTLFSVTDADGDTPTQYVFEDDGTGGGHFTVNGVTQAAFTGIAVSDPSTVQYVAGSGAGSETLWVKVNDGTVWSAWQSWQEQTLRATNTVAVLSAPANKNVLQNEWHQFSEFVSVTDADGDRMVRFEVKDDNAAAGSAFLQWNGVNTQGGLVQAETGSLGDLWVKGGANLGSDTIEIRAFDGYDWSDWKSVSVNTRVPNRAPVAVPTAATQAVVTGNSVAASTLFSVTDADGDTPTQYVFEDDGTGGGHFTVNGVTQAAFTGIAVSDPSTVQYVAGSGAGSETLWVKVNDGTVWSAWQSWQEQTLRATNTVAVLSAPANKNVLQNEWHQFSEFVSVTDADGDRMVRFEVKDDNAAAGSAFLQWNGVNTQGGLVQAETGSLGDLWVKGGANLGSDTIEIRAFDGYDWSDWKSVSVNTRVPNRAPVAVPTAATQAVVTGNSVAASTLFSVTDADGDTPTQYVFEDDGTGGGHFTVNGVTQAAFTGIAVSDPSTVQYVAGSGAGSETLWVKVNDGTVWSAWQSWQEQTLRATNTVAVLSAPANKNVLQNEWHQFSEFVSVTDADGDRMVRFEVKDDNAAAGSAFLQWNGVNTQGGLVQAETGSLGDLWVKGGANLGSDTIEIRAFDGYDWSDWKSVSVNTRVPNRAPVAVPTAATQAVVTGNSVAASTLFSVTDADGDTPTQYVFEDDGTGGGHFTVNGVTQAAFTGIAVSDPSTVQYVAGSGAGSETLWVKVNDGTVWSAWQSWQMATYQPLRETEVVGGSAADVIAGQPEHVYFGGKGADRFVIATTASDTEEDAVYMGGIGNDRYEIAAGATATIFENGDDAADTLTIDGFAFNRASSFIGSIDGRHLIMFDVNSGTGIVQLDWLDPANRIEHYVVSGTSYTFEEFFAQFVAIDPLRYVQVEWSDLDELKAQRDEWISFYEDRNRQILEASNQPPVVTASDTTFTARDWHPIKDLISSVDPDPEDANVVRLWEFANIGGSDAQGRLGRITSGGLSLDNPTSVTSLDDMYVLGGDVGTSHTYSARAFDGIEWSDWVDFTVQATAPRGDYPATSALTTVTLSGTPSVYQDYVGGSDVSDVYRLDLSAPQTLDLAFSDVQPGYNIAFDLARADVIVIGGVEHVSERETIRQETVPGLGPTSAVYHMSLDAGTYLLNVHEGFSGYFNSSDYELSLSQSASQPLHLYARDMFATPGTQVALRVNGLFDLVEQWRNAQQYEYRIPSGLALSASATPETPGDPATYSFGPSFAPFLSAAAEGTYTVSARAFDGSGWGDWVDARLTVMQDRAGDLFHPREIAATSTPQTFHDYLAMTATPLPDTIDTYHFTLSGAKTVSFAVGGLGADVASNPTGTENGVQFDLYSGTGGSLHAINGQTAVAGQAGLTKSVFLAAGDYTVALTSQRNTLYDFTIVAPP